ncbi:uncharacterized protein FTJAE_10992 [Fusarium tjaetaba]|uniref:Gamma-glutamylcyclotransferase AIG2-like domain-containing protein n=1 Tax=Fusarium tjaetaba TaxID=1567544 RepID=A0A8H5QWR5_9HYPO|nr:uncharacterized protein FTJAE_10992 [Fusarium tjaetaba]KAF5622258.1 hypothetical protein FTJAE_10992 [Fusarium tjaetaba]
MAVSKAVSEQELEAKVRREIQASMVELKAQERHRRKLEAAKFLIKLEWPLDSPETVAQAAGIPSPDEGAISGPCYFLEINAINKAAIEAYLKTNLSLSGFSPTFIPWNPARKSLSPPSLHPTLDIESTLPHQRLEYVHDEPCPAQNEYPVWYFIYGDLADPSVLVELLGDNLRFYTAEIIGGGYMGNFSPANNVEDLMSLTSIALQVETQEQEDMLRAYQGDAYEVVRCPIYVACTDYIEFLAYGEEVPGLTFRLIKKATD